MNAEPYFTRVVADEKSWSWKTIRPHNRNVFFDRRSVFFLECFKEDVATKKNLWLKPFALAPDADPESRATNLIMTDCCCCCRWWCCCCCFDDVVECVAIFQRVTPVVRDLLLFVLWVPSDSKGPVTHLLVEGDWKNSRCCVVLWH